MDRLFQKGYQPPFTCDRFGSHIWDANRNMAMQFVSFDIKKEMAESVIRCINNREGIFEKVEYDPQSGVISIDDVEVLLIRGWGYLTGAGGLSLPDQEAISIQNDFADYVVEQLTLTPKES